MNDGLPDVQGVQDVSVGPGEALGRGLNAGPLVVLLVHAAAIVFDLLKDNKLRKLVLDVADKKKIPVQLAASSTSTGTDTDAFAYSNGGVPSVLISLPLKYMHTTCETVHKDDVKSVIKMIYHTLLNLEENHNFKYNS